jgi:hypothetical protein
MANYEEVHHGPMPQERETTLDVLAGGSMAEAVGGIGAAVLAILGLAGIVPQDMAAIATMAVGVALLLEGVTIASRFSNLVSQTRKSLSEEVKVGGGMGAEFLGGVAGGILGLLAILGIVPATLTAIAIIVFGASLLLSSGTTYRIDSLAGKLAETNLTTSQTLATMAASSVQVLAGIAGIALGIIALVGITPMVLTLVGLLSIGTSVLLTGGAVSGTIASVMQ